MVWPMLENREDIAKAFYYEKPQVYRGLSELRPKSFDIVKSLVSIVREWNLEAQDPLLVFANLLDSEAKRLLSYLPEMDRILIVSPTLPTFFKIFESISFFDPKPVTLICTGSMHEEQNISDLLFAQSICFNDPTIEVRASELVLKRLRHIRIEHTEHQPILFEEKPGRFESLEVEENTAKYNTKKLSQYINSPSRDSGKQPFFTDPGFSLCYFKIASSTLNKEQQKGNFANCEVRYPGIMNFDAILVLEKKLESLLRTNKLQNTVVKNIYISTPWLATSAYIAERLKQDMYHDAEAHHLDHCFGWNPLATYLQSIAELNQAANLYIYFGPHKIYLSLTWK